MFQNQDGESLSGLDFSRIEDKIPILIVAIALALSALFLLSQNPNLEGKQTQRNGSYPVHPTLKDCEMVEDPFQKRFCIADVAEIQENVEICQKIGDYENIKKFCVARVTLNKTMCKQLQDEKLEQSCLESINLKEKWRNETKTNK